MMHQSYRIRLSVHQPQKRALLSTYHRITFIMKDYKKHFTEGKFWKRLPKIVQQAGMKAVYTALLLYNAYQRKETPVWARRIIMGALGYLLMPIDALPDITPIVGYTDDLGVLGLGLVTVAAYVNDEVRAKSRQQLAQWFGEVDEAELRDVDEQL